MNNNFTRKFNIKGFSSRACLDLYIALSLMPNAVKRGMADKEERKERERCTKEGRKETIIYLIFYELSFPPPKKKQFWSTQNLIGTIFIARQKAIIEITLFI